MPRYPVSPTGVLQLVCLTYSNSEKYFFDLFKVSKMTIFNHELFKVRKITILFVTCSKSVKKRATQETFSRLDL